ncbi:hypothetical protein AM609_06425 [Actinomyces sp. oral taxon 414]|uniref:hypothetical protein n=1 Tax=Actinomyces sp. oral taxon 414 TaxID=712122 RepID=UPI0006AFB7ED|nr:hypothetical protein [Actinomyces sp. oral taxon 414]ALC99213.1 hypothetical protein AM609_06425 [Actinomyces sp. oral taxon 414]
MSSDRPTDNRPAHSAAALLRALSDTRLAAGVRSRLRRARRRPRRSAAAVAVVTVLALIWAQGVTGGTQARAEEARSLESIDIAVSPSGAVTAVSGTTVSVSPDGRRAAAGTRAYAPRDVAKDLPVRVRTAYRTADGAGTDLSEIAGHTGRVTIDVFVENLTVKPQSLTYDVAGTAHTRTALVGAPLTLSAAVSLDTDPDSVITASSDAQGVTNGVLSRTGDGKSQVQWAALLAPPQLGATADLRLVVDAVDFKVPEFDLSVQTGLITDPSVQGLMDAAFRTDTGSQLALTTSTIEVLSQVNESLAKAHAIVDRVSTTLTGNAGTIGTQTLADLTSSSQSLSSSMQSIGTDLSGLTQTLTQTLTSAQSSTASQLLQVVNTASAIMGDTSEPAQVPSLESLGCQAQAQPGAEPTAQALVGSETPAPAPAAGSGDAAGSAGSGSAVQADSGNGVYGSVNRVSGLLQAYAQANDECRAAVQAQLSEALGDADTSTCTQGSVSATCSLAAAQQQVNAAVASLGEQADAVTAALQPETRADVLTSSTTLGEKVTGVETALNRLAPSEGGEGTGDLSTELETLNQAVDALTPGVDALVSTLDGIHSWATTAQTNNTTARGQIEAAAADLCTEIASAKNPALLQQARARLTSTPCPGAGGGAADNKPADNKPDDKPADNPGGGDAADDKPADNKPDDGSSADAALSAQSTNLEQIATASDTTTPGGATKKDVDAVRTAVADVVAARDAIVLAVDGAPDDPSKPSLSGSLKDLRTAVTDLRSGYDALSASVTKLDQDQSAAAAGVRTAFDKTAQETTDAVSTTVGTQIRLIGAQAETSRAAVGASFDAATSGMRTSADAITSDSARTIQAQTAQIQDQVAGSSAALSSQIEGSLTSMTQGLTGSVVDIEAARSLLTSDLDRVLLDIGSPDGSGTGLVGIMSSSAALAGSAGYQVAAANQAVAAHGAVRAQDMEGILLQQAQVKASLQAQSRVTGLATPRSAAEQRTMVYNFRVGGSR